MTDGDWRTTPKSYVWLHPNNYDDVQVGDVVRISHKDIEDTHMGKVVYMDGWELKLNNREEYFPLMHWHVTVLHRAS